MCIYVCICVCGISLGHVSCVYMYVCAHVSLGHGDGCVCVYACMYVCVLNDITITEEGVPQLDIICYQIKPAVPGVIYILLSC